MEAGPGLFLLLEGMSVGEPRAWAPVNSAGRQLAVAIC